ncbi:MAG: MBL fold metallo-hydrolase [Verrucomicrobiota bacterium]|nr:MBL fold metallo-hydrolase [Verrucomicrobiota bacterium]
MNWHFLGGTSEVTGSKHILETQQARILFDCGLFQGRRKQADEINHTLDFTVESIDAMVLSHAHIDHCGNIPTLAKRGYRNPVHATSATADLLPVMLRDSAHIHESDAAYLNQKTNRKGLPPIIPLYTLEDAEASFPLLRVHQYNEPIELPGGIRLTHVDAGHILGAALALIEVPREGRAPLRIGYAVDLGRHNLPLLEDPVQMTDLDVLICESTYGGREHGDALDAEAALGDAINRTIARGGKVLLPTFALERAQEIIYHISSLRAKNVIPDVPVFMDSPMAQALSTIFEKNHTYFDAEYKALHKQVGSVITPPWLTFTATVDESKSITSSKEPSIVLAASGMAEHGRILHHLKHGIEDEKNLVLFVGYQAANTLGRRLINGESPVRIFGDMFDVGAEIGVINAFSAHAGRSELRDYIQKARPKQVFLVHGEQEQREALAKLVQDELRIPVALPNNGDVVDFDALD